MVKRGDNVDIVLLLDLTLRLSLGFLLVAFKHRLFFRSVYQILCDSGSLTEHCNIKLPIRVLNEKVDESGERNRRDREGQRQTDRVRDRQRERLGYISGNFGNKLIWQTFAV